MSDRLGIAVIGAGYWGPNLVRNFSASERLGPGRRLRPRPPAGLARGERALGGLRDRRRQRGAGRRATSTRSPSPRPHAPTRASPWPRCAPASTSSSRSRSPTAARAARRCCGRLATSGLVLMADHTYCYTPAVGKIRELLADDALGEILFIDSVRINLGLIQPDVDVLWDLAPHDLSVFDFVLPGGLDAARRLRAGCRPAPCRQGVRRSPDPPPRQRRAWRTCTSTG